MVWRFEPPCYQDESTSLPPGGHLMVVMWRGWGYVKTADVLASGWETNYIFFGVIVMFFHSAFASIYYLPLKESLQMFSYTTEYNKNAELKYFLSATNLRLRLCSIPWTLTN